MHIQSSARYLEIINHGLTNVLGPRLDDAHSKAVLGVLQVALKELYKRELRTPGLLAEGNRKGLVLAGKIQALIAGIVGGEVKESDRAKIESIPDAGADAGYNRLREINNELNGIIARLAKELAALRSHDLSRSRQDEISKLMREAADWDYSYSVAQRQAIDFDSFNLDEPPEGEEINLENLQAFVDAQRPDEGIRVSNLSDIPGGMGKHTYKCAFNKPDGNTDEVVIRKQDISPTFTRGVWSIDAEYLLLGKLYGAGFNVPKPLMLAHNEKAFNTDFFIMEKKEGVVPGNFFGPTMEIKEELLLDLAAHMAQLHSIPIETFSDYITEYLTPDLLTANVKEAYRIELESWLEYVEDKPLNPSPALMYTLDWLLENIPENSQKPVLVHGDFNVHNFLVENGKISTVLDWEMAIFGDPAQDIAYIKPNVEKYIDWEKFVQHYYDCGGRKVDVSTFDYFAALANARPLMGCLKTMGLFDQARTCDVRLPTMDADFLPQFMKNILDHSY